MQNALRRLLGWTHRQPLSVIYGLATGILALTTTTRWLLEPFIGPYLFLTFLGAVIACALLLGRGTSLYALVLGAFLASLLFIEPAFSLALNHEESVALFLFLTIGLIAACGIEGIRNLAQDLTATERGHDALIRELHHRTRNNLQLLIAVTAMYGAQAKSTEAKRILAALSERIASFSRLQELIYAPTSSVEGVDAEELISGLCNAFSISLLLQQPVTLSCSASPAKIPQDVAAVIAIAVNELLTNAVKYAFSDGRPGTISVRLRVEPDDMLTVTVEDDGEGCPVPPAEGTGLTLISILLKQHGGYVSHEDAAPGCRARIRLPLPSRT